MNLARDVKDNKKGLCKYICDKWKTRENVGLLLYDTGDLVTQDRKKCRGTNVFFICLYQQNYLSEILGKSWTKEEVALEED